MGRRLRPLVLQAEAQLHGHLIVLHLAVLDVAADLFDLEPADIPEREGGLLDRPIDGFADALLGRADDLDDFVKCSGIGGFALFCPLY